MTIDSPEAAFPLVSPIVTRLFAINVQKKVKHTHKGQTQNKQEGKLPQTDRASDFGRKSQIFPNLRIKRPPVDGILLDFYNRGRRQENESHALPGGRKNLTIYAFVSMQYQRVTVRQTDGQICYKVWFGLLLFNGTFSTNNNVPF